LLRLAWPTAPRARIAQECPESLGSPRCD